MVEHDARPGVRVEGLGHGRGEDLAPRRFLFALARGVLLTQPCGIRGDGFGLDGQNVADERHRLRALHPRPHRLVLGGHAKERADDLREHRAEVRGGILRVVHLRAEEGLRDARATCDRGRGHEDVDTEARNVGVPHRLLEVGAREVGAEAELAADGLPNP